MLQLYQCYRCGASNPAGQNYCSQCGVYFYYACPHCGSMVYTALDTCPCCFRRIDWSYGAARQEIRSGSSGALALAISSVLLFVIAFVLIQMNSSPVGNAHATTTTTSASTFNAGSSVVPSQITMSSQGCANGQCSGVTYTDAAAPYSDMQTLDCSTPYVSEEINLPVNQNSGSVSGTYTPDPSDYLKQICPNWGHCGSCSGGRCNSIYLP